MAYLPNLAFQPYVTPSTGGEPIKELSDLGQNLNNIYNTSIAKQDALDEHLAQVKATLSPVDHPLVDAIEQGTRGDLADIQKNGNWENAEIPLRAAAKRLLANPALIVAQQNATQRQKLDEESAQAQAQGHHLIQYKDWSNTPSVNADGSFNKITSDGSFDKRLDYQSKMQSVFQGLEANSSAYKDSSPQRDESTGAIYQIGSGSSKRYVNTKMIKNVVANNLDNYLNTDEGQQRLKVLTTQNSDNAVPLDTKTAREQIKNELTNVGLTRRFNDVSSDNSERLAPSKATKIVNPLDGTVAVQDTAVPINQDFSNLKEALTKKDRSVSPIWAAMATPVGGGNPYADNLKVSHNTTPTYDNDVLKASPLYQSMFKLYSQSLGTTNPDKINPLVSKYLSGIQDRTISPILHATSDPKTIKADNDFIQNGAVKLVPVYDNSTGKTYNSMQDPKFLEDYPDIKSDDFDKAKMVGRYNENHPYADVTGNDNFTTARKISVGGHDFVAGEFAQDKRSDANLNNYLGNKITQVDRMKTPITFTDGKNNMKIFPSGDGRYVVQGKDSQGKDLPLVPLTLEQAKTFLATSGHTEIQK